MAKTQMLACSPLDPWKSDPQVAAASDELSIGLPLHVLEGEAIDVATFLDAYWEDQTLPDGRVIRGLSSVEDPRRYLTESTSADIRSLERALHEAHGWYRASLGLSSDGDELERAKTLVSKLDAALDWWLDDGVENEKDAEFSRLREEHANAPSTTDALAAELDDYASLAERHRSELDGLGGFDAKMIDEAAALSASLRERPPGGARRSSESRAALSLRNRICNVLWDRMTTVRAAAKFVFQDHPAIVRQATSQYERRRRNEARRRAAEPKPAPVEPAS